MADLRRRRSQTGIGGPPVRETDADDKGPAMPIGFGRSAPPGALPLLTAPGLGGAGAKDGKKLFPESAPATKVNLNPPTGTARFVRLPPAAPAALARGRTP